MDNTSARVTVGYRAYERVSLPSLVHGNPPVDQDRPVNLCVGTLVIVLDWDDSYGWARVLVGNSEVRVPHSVLEFCDR